MEGQKFVKDKQTDRQTDNHTAVFIEVLQQLKTTGKFPLFLFFVLIPYQGHDLVEYMGFYRR